MSGKPAEEVLLFKERHIPVSKDHFLSTLLSKFDDEEAKLFGEFASCIEALFYVNGIASIEAFKQCYSCFSRLMDVDHSHALSSDELSLRQSALMHMIYKILSDAHFEAVTFEMYKNSIEKVFLSDLPIKVDWAKLDSSLWTQFYKQFPSQNPYATVSLKPPFHQHFSMFYRGYGLKTMSGLFIIQKLNLILADLVPILQSIMSQCIAFMTATLFSAESLAKEDTNNTESSKNEVEPQLDMIALQRISLLDTYNTANSKGSGALLWWFFKNIDIQEPTFKRLLLIYREIPESFVAEQTRKLKQRASSIRSKIKQSAEKKLGLTPSQEESAESEAFVDEIGRKRNPQLLEEPEVMSTIANKESCLYPIRIQYFSDIPMSDLEITYPVKRFSLKPMDQLYLTFTMFFGVWGIFTELLFSTDTSIGYWLVMISIFLMIRSLIWYRMTESEYVRVLNQSLVESNISSDKDTILSLMDSVDEQQFMETILAYFVILKNEKEAITNSDGVDRLCEQFVREAFGEDINVRIEGAMRKLSELGLFKISGVSKDDSMQVKQLSDSLSCVQSHYQSSIQTFRKIAVDTFVRNKDADEEQEEERKIEIDDEKVKSDESESKTPPIITDKQISDNHFDDIDDTQLVD